MTELRNTFLLFIVGFSVLLLSGCGSLFFYPKKQLFENPVAARFSPEDVIFKSPDGLSLHGWFFRAKPEARGTILVLHGNAENLSTHVNSVLWLVKEGFNVFIFDYRGYGLSEGTPSIKGVHRDAEAALQEAFSLAPAHGRIVVLGQSIGGAIAVYAVAHSREKDRIAALAVDSAFSSYRLIAREKLGQCCLTFQYPLSFLIDDDYSPVKWIKQVSPVPLLVMHGQQDPIVPFHHGKILFAAASGDKEFWETPAPGHICAFQDASIREKFIEYLDRQLRQSSYVKRE